METERKALSIDVEAANAGLTAAPVSPTATGTSGTGTLRRKGSTASENGGTSTPGSPTSKKALNPEGTHTHTGSRTGTSKTTIFRRKIWLMNGVMTVFLITLALVQILVPSRYFNSVKERKAQIALEVVKTELLKEEGRMAVIATDHLVDLTFEDYDINRINGLFINATAHRQSLEDFYRNRAIHYDFEVATVVDTDAKILASAYDTRIGTVFDPHEVATRVINSFPSKQKVGSSLLLNVETAIISYQQFQEMNAPFILTDEIDGLANNHIAITKTYGLMMFVCAPILSSSEELLGVLILGNLLTGKHRIVRQASDLLGSLTIVGIMYNHENAWKSSQVAWPTTNRMDFDLEDDFTVPEGLASGQVKYSKEKSEDGDNYVVAITPFDQSYTKSFEGTENRFIEEANILLVGGISELKTDSLHQSLTIATFSFLCGALVFISIFASLTDRWFIHPLEVLARAVEKKNHNKVQETLQSMKQMNLSEIKIAFGIISVSSIVGSMLFFNYSGIGKTFIVFSESWSKLKYTQAWYHSAPEINVMYSLDYTEDWDVYVISSRNSSDEEARVHANIELGNYMNKSESELGLLISSDKKILASGSGIFDPTQDFDPNGLITACLETGMQIRANIVLQRDLYLSLNPLSWTSSSLSVENTDSDAVLQLVAVPVPSRDDGSLNSVIVFGKILNGKDSVTARAMSKLGDGCSAIYYAVDGESPKLVAYSLKLPDSALESNEDPAKFDSFTEEVEEGMEEGDVYRHYKFPAFGTTVEITVAVAFPGAQYDSESNEHLTGRFDSTIYLLQCSDLTAWNKLDKSMLALAVSGFILHFFASIILAYFTYQPIYQFRMRYEQKWVDKSRRSTTVAALAKLNPFKTSQDGSTVAGSPRTSQREIKS